MPLVAAIQLPAALAYIFDGIFLGARDFRFLGIAMVLPKPKPLHELTRASLPLYI